MRSSTASNFTAGDCVAYTPRHPILFPSKEGYKPTCLGAIAMRKGRLFRPASGTNFLRPPPQLTIAARSRNYTGTIVGSHAAGAIIP